MSQNAAEPRHVTVEGSEGSRQQRKEQERVQVSRVRQVWSGCEIQRSKRVRSKQEKLGRDEMHRHGERRSECAGDWSSVVAREKSQDSGWNRFVCCSDCVRSVSLVRNEKLQVLCGSECSKGKLRGVSFWYLNPRMAETCEVLVAVSESDMSQDVFFPCHDEGTQACAYHEGCGTKLELEQIEDMAITIANSEYMRCLKRARSSFLRSFYRTTDGLRKAREDATRRVAMSSGG